MRAQQEHQEEEDVNCRRAISQVASALLPHVRPDFDPSNLSSQALFELADRMPDLLHRITSLSRDFRFDRASDLTLDPPFEAAFARVLDAVGKAQSGSSYEALMPAVGEADNLLVEIFPQERALHAWTQLLVGSRIQKSNLHHMMTRGTWLVQTGLRKVADSRDASLQQLVQLSREELDAAMPDTCASDDVSPKTEKLAAVESVPCKQAGEHITMPTPRIEQVGFSLSCMVASCILAGKPLASAVILFN